jgi:hypothetical protein
VFAVALRVSFKLAAAVGVCQEPLATKAEAVLQRCLHFLSSHLASIEMITLKSDLKQEARCV